MINVIYSLQKHPLISSAEFMERFNQVYQPLFKRFAKNSGAKRFLPSFKSQNSSSQGFTPKAEAELDALLELSWSKSHFEQLPPEQLDQLRQLFASLGGLVNLHNSQLTIVEPQQPRMESL